MNERQRGASSTGRETRLDADPGSVAPMARPRAAAPRGSAPGTPEAATAATAGAAHDMFGDAIGAGVHRESGHALPADLRARFETSLGADLGAVRLHTGSDAAASAAAMGARAFAAGNDIAFGAGQYDPSSPAGEHLIAHEVAHTVQQGGRPVGPQMKLEVGGASTSLEAEADRAAERMVIGTPAGGLSSTGPVIQRIPHETAPASSPAHAFEYRPAERADVVWSETSTLPQIATELYGNAALASHLVELHGTPRAVRFRPTLLAPEWRATYYRHRAGAAARTEVRGETVLVLPASGSAEALVEAVVLYDPHPATESAVAPAAPSTPPRTPEAAVAPETEPAYDATRDYGDPVGELGDIAGHPENFAALLGGTGDEPVTVSIDPVGPFADMISSRMSRPVMTRSGSRAPVDPLDPLGLSRLSRTGAPVSLLPPTPTLTMPASGPTIRAVPRGGCDLVALEAALATHDGATRSGDSIISIHAADRLPVMVLDPSAPEGVRTEGRFIVVGGARARGLAGRFGAPTYQWSGHGALEPLRAAPAASSAAAPTPAESLFAPAVDPMAPLLGDAVSITWVHYTVMSASELRAIVRRYTTQRMLRSAEDDDGHRADVDRDRLADLGTGAAPVHGTAIDVEDHGTRAVESGRAPTTTDAAPRAEHTTLTVEAIRERFTVAGVMLDDLVGSHAEIAALVRDLGARLTAHRAELDRSPAQRDVYAAMIANVLRVVPSCSRQLANIRDMLAETTNEASRAELRHIRDIYSMALSYADQEQSSRTLFNTANRRLTVFPLFDLEHRGDADHDGAAAVLDAPEGEDSALMSVSVRARRYIAGVFSREPNEADYTGLLRELDAARDAAHRGDTAGATTHATLAAAVESRMHGRHVILTQLHQALVAFEAFGRSSAAFTQVFTHDDERLELLIRTLTTALRRYEGAEDESGRLRVLQEVSALWASDEAYQAFYAHVDQFIARSDFSVRLAIVVAAGVLSMGVGSAAVGAGATALEATALEATAFAVADRSATAVFMPSTSDAEHPSTESGGERAYGWGRDIAMNMAMMGMARGIGGMWQGLGRDLPTAMRMGGEMVTTFAAFEAVGVVSHAATHHGELPSGGAFGDMTEQNAITLVAMSVMSAVARPMFQRIQIEAALRIPVRAGGHARAMEVINARQTTLHARVVELMGERGPGGSASEPTVRAQRELARIQNEVESLQGDAARIVRELDGIAEWQAANDADASLTAASRALADRLDVALETNREVAFAARVGLRTVTGGDGSYLQYNPGATEMVREYYASRDYTVTETTVDGRPALEVRRGAVRHRLFESGSVLGRTLGTAIRSPAEPVSSGSEVHNHFNGINHASDIVDTLYDGNWANALADLQGRFRRMEAQQRGNLATRRASLDTQRGAERARTEREIAEIEAELRRIAPALDALRAATSETARTVVRDVLEASETTPYDVSYSARGALLDPSLAPAGTEDPSALSASRARLLVHRTLERLVEDGVHDVEVQGGLPASVSEADFARMCAELRIRVRFLRIMRSSEFSVHAVGSTPDAIEGSRSSDLAEVLAADLTSIAGSAPGEPLRNLARELASVPETLRGSIMQMIRSPSTVGMDIASPERNMFTAGGMRTLAQVYRVLRLAHQVVGREFVLRPHVGEGYDDVTMPGATPEGAHAASEATATHNVEMVIAALRGIEYQPGHGVIVRLGHLTHATDAQIAQLAGLGVIAEVNLGSNIATGSIRSPEAHPLLAMLYSDMPVILSTDAGGVMRTSLEAEYLAVDSTILAPFRAGRRERIGDREVSYVDLAPSVQERFTLAHLRARAEEYTRSIAVHRDPTAPVPMGAPHPRPADDHDETRPVTPTH